MQRYKEQQQRGERSPQSVLQLQEEIDNAQNKAEETQRETDLARQQDAGFFRKWRNLLRLRRDQAQ